MSAAATSSNPCLVAILLVCNTRTGAGAQIVYHYPANPFASNHRSSSSSVDTDDASSTDTDESSSTDDDLSSATRSRRVAVKAGNFRSASVNDANSDEDEKITERGKSSGHVLLGLPEDGLVSLLAPERIWHKRKFEISINDLTFIGRPVFVRHTGAWRKYRRFKRDRKHGEGFVSDTESGSENETRAVDLRKKSKKDAAVQPPIEKSQLTMFHLVFVMNPPPLEHANKVKDMYDHIVRKFSQVLRLEQVHHDYVWQQIELIINLKATTSAKKKSRSQLYADVAAKSSLAAAVANVYTAISDSRLASVSLSPGVQISLQIPLVTSTAYLPSLNDPPLQPGIWLTTATDIGAALSDQDDLSSNSIKLAKHYTLLLKAPPQRIVKEVQDEGGAVAHYLPRFLTALRPTKSFYKLSLSSQISLPDVQLLAQHLIDWRRAIAIPPLHQLDTYIVSPNADLSKLREASRSYESQFPNSIPSLPKMLSAMSGIPKPYATLIPNGQKERYCFALAWLMRHGWVTQLRTFAYIKVRPYIKRNVQDADKESRFRPSQRQLSREASNEGQEAARMVATRPRLVSNPSSEGKRSIENHRLAFSRRMSSLILNPPRASSEESKWLEYITRGLRRENELQLSITEEDRIELQKYWPVFIKYFNGRVALETISIQENLKKKHVSQLLDRLGLAMAPGVDGESLKEEALLLTVRHW